MTAATTPATDLSRRLELVVRLGLTLTRTSDLEAIVQAATDAGLQLSGAQFGAFFDNAEGKSDPLYVTPGATREQLAAFSMPRASLIFGPTSEGRDIVRSGDITKDPCHGRDGFFIGTPKEQLPVRSYLALRVTGQSGEVLGTLLYGHEQTDVFGQETEDLIATIAAQAAVAIEYARLRKQLTQKIADLANAEARHKNASKRLGEFAAIVECSDDAIISKDLTGRITSWNPAATRILGYSSEEMIGESILKIIPEELHSDEPIILARIRAGQRIEHFETVRVKKSGERVDVSLSISPVRDESGQIIGAAKILRDISANKALELSLLQAEKIAATGRIAATIAHEINNPLEAIVNLLYLARDQATDPAQIDYLTAAESEVSRVSHIAKQTLGYYRDPLRVINSSLSEIAAEAIRIYEPRCRAAGIHLQSCLDPTPPITLRKGEIMQVISNLISNAIYAMPSGGILSIVVRRTGPLEDGVVLSIEDTGVGIAPEKLPLIFSAFYTTRSTVGTGIGLFVAKQFIEGHGGRIDVESDTGASSHGTRMSIFLPLQTQYAAA